jgi:hypothetical protein
VGTSASFAELAAKCRAAGAAIEAAAPDAVNAGAFVIKRELVEAIGGAVGRDLKFSGKIKVNVHYRIAGRGPIQTATVRAVGPVHWLSGTKPHDITGRKRQGGKAGRVKFGDGEIRDGVRHPGSRPKPVWQAAKNRAARPSAEAMRDVYVEAVRLAFT